MERDNIQLMLTLRRPVKVLIQSKEGYREIPSVLRFRALDKMFLNSWNLRQVVFLEGTLELATRLDTLIKVVQSTDMVPRISATDLGNVRVLDPTEAKCKELHDKMMKNNESFNREIGKLVVPLRFSVLALMCGKKSTVFDDSLVRLMQYLAGMKFEGKRIYKMQYSIASEEEKSSLVESEGEEDP